MTTGRWGLVTMAWVILTFAGIAGGQGITTASPEQLQQWLRQYPEADANGDGRLSVAEAEAYRQTIERRMATRQARKPSFRHEFTFATMSDGVKIALAVGYPRDFDPAADRRWPAIFTTCGYPGAATPVNPGNFADRYVTVNASLRGSGASGGALDPWQPRTWQDGYEVIEEWIVKQPWSSGKVGLVGHSWPGLMGFLTATTNPPSLKAVCVSGLIDDFYRGIGLMGGVRNSGFPVDWLNAFYRPGGPFDSGIMAAAVRGLDEPAYQAIVASRPARDYAQDMLWLGLHDPLDGPPWRVRSLGTHAAQIRAPILIGHTWQDEQTGPTGWQLWRRIADGVPKRLAVSNGHHGTTPFRDGEMQAWFDRWLTDDGPQDPADAQPRVQVYFETAGSGRSGQSALGEPLVAAAFPLPETRWTRYYLHGGNVLSTTGPAADEGADSYQVFHVNQQSDETRVYYLTEFSEPTAVLGPATVTLWASVSTLDTDFYVLLADQAPDGTIYGLQRGLLRASHRRIDPEKSLFVPVDGERVLSEPFHPHEQPEPLAPHEPTEFQIQVHAVGHVFRPGHKLVLAVTRPPLGDPIGVTRSGDPSYRYDSDAPAAEVRVYHDADHPSSILLPILPQLPPLPGEPVPIDQQAGLQPVE